jgi:hypothetical protein
LDTEVSLGSRRMGPLRTSLLSHRVQIATIGIAAVLLCLTGLVYALVLGDASDAGRGGAITVALSFAAFFTSSATPSEIIEARGLDGKCHFDELSYKERVTRLKTAVAMLDDRHNTESLCLAITTFMGTMFWGFGDLLAIVLGATAGQ